MSNAITETTALERHIRETIPLARAIDVRVGEYDGYRLQLSGPLGPNINDKGCAFGGSITSLLTLAGWGLINLKLGEAGIDADVFVQDSSVLYLAPVWDEILAEAYAPDNVWPEFLAGLRERGRARITIEAEVTAPDGAGVAVRQTARFVAKVATG